MTEWQAHDVAVTVVMATFLALHLPAAFAGNEISSWEPQSGDDYRITVDNRMGANMHMSCRAVFGFSGGNEFFHSFRADPHREEVLPFIRPMPGRPPLRLTCKWAYDGNYMKGVTLFSTRWPEASACQRRAGECAIVFEDRKMFIAPKASAGRGRLLGDLPVIQCKKVLLFFDSRCSYPEHEHQYVGRILRNLAEYMMA